MNILWPTFSVVITQKKKNDKRSPLYVTFIVLKLRCDLHDCFTNDKAMAVVPIYIFSKPITMETILAK
jgi:hypothetical protein